MGYMKDVTGRRLDTIAQPVVDPPTGFPARAFLPALTVFRLGGGKFRASLSLTSVRPAGATVRYVDRAGSSGNDGLTAATPWNVATAITAINAGSSGQYTIVMNAGEYQATAWATLTKSCNWVAAKPGVRLTCWASPGLTWTAVSGSAGASGTIYGTAKLSTNGVYDLVNLVSTTNPATGQVYSDYTTYVNKGTGANQAAALALITGDGQYAFDGTNVYVRPIGTADLTNSTTRNNVRLRQNNTSGLVASGAGVVVFAENINFEGHTTGGFASQNNALMVARDCTFKYNFNNGTSHEGGHVVHIRCTAAWNGRDGFNYHDTAGNNVEILEVDCVAYANGMQDTNENNNGSTSHDTCRIIRVGGTFWNNTGPTVIDVTAVKSWNLGIYSGDSLAASAGNRVNFKTDTTSEMWLDECYTPQESPQPSGGSGGTGKVYRANDSSKIHVAGPRGFRSPTGSIDTGGSGTVDFYTPADAA